jgi:ankyrin repeat protein
VTLQDQDLDAVDDKGHTALHLAAKGGSVSLIMILNEFGSDVEAKDMFGRTPLHHAVAHRHEGATKSLLQCGVSNPLTMLPPGFPYRSPEYQFNHG